MMGKVSTKYATHSILKLTQHVEIKTRGATQHVKINLTHTHTCLPEYIVYIIFTTIYMNQNFLYEMS
jgi:hypothetical protein